MNIVIFLTALVIIYIKKQTLNYGIFQTRSPWEGALGLWQLPLCATPVPLKMNVNINKTTEKDWTQKKFLFTEDEDDSVEGVGDCGKLANSN